jgi:hypothetical protein
MKEIIFITLSTIFVLSGCKSKEDKALEVIKNQMFQTLYDFESYQPIETKIDSAFLSIYTDSTIIRHGYIINELLEKVNKAFDEINEYKNSMEIWSDSYSSYGIKKFYEAKEKYGEKIEEAKLYSKMINAESDTIKLLAQNITPDFYGWKVAHKFRCKTKGGNSEIGNYIYYFDKKIKNIIYQEDIDNEDLIRAKEFIKESLEKDTLLRW